MKDKNIKQTKKQKKAGRKSAAPVIISIAVLAALVFVLVAPLAFVGVTVADLNGKMQERKQAFYDACEERQVAVDVMVAKLKPKMELEPKVFINVSSASTDLKEATDVRALSTANAKYDWAIDRLKYVMYDKYPYLESEEVIAAMEDITTAQNRIIVECEAYNDLARDYNYTIANFPGDMIAKVFGLEKSGLFYIIENK